MQAAITEDQHSVMQLLSLKVIRVLKRECLTALHLV